MLEVLVTFIDRFKYTIIGTMLLVLSIVIISSHAKIETKIEVFLPGYKPGKPITEIDDPSVQNLVRMSLKFGDKSSVTVIYHSEKSLDNQGALSAMRKLQDKLEKMQYVKSIISVLNYPDSEAYISGDALDIKNLPENMKHFVSKDGKYAMFIVVVEINGAVEPIVRKITNELKGEPVIVLSEASVNNKLFDELKRSMFFYPVIMFVVILLIFSYQTQSLRAAVISLLIPILAAIYTYALYFFFGGVVNVLTAMVMSFLIIIGSAYPLHFYNATFRTENARKYISAPIFLSMLTTAIGFLSFLFVKIPAFREFGILVSVGLLIDFLLTLTIGHEMMAFSKSKTKVSPKTFGIRYFGNKVASTILIIVIIAVITAPFLISKIKVGLTNTDYFSKNSEIVKGYNILETQFGIRDSIYVVLEKKVGVFLPGDNKNINEIIDELSKSSYIANVDFPKNIPITALVFTLRNQPLLKHYIADGRTVRLTVNLTKEGNENLDKVSALINEVVGKYNYDFYIAGSPFVWKAVNDSILISQIQSLVAALVIVFITILIVFKNFGEAIKLMSPVLFATILNFVYMALFKMKLEISTALTSSIIIGLAIDYSIHVGHDYNRTKNIITSVRNVGPAILGNALGIIGGFLTLLFGGELALFKRISVLVSLGIATATLLTLTVLPFMLSYTELRKKIKAIKKDKKSKGGKKQ
ncbi:MAG: efflux RND transporter permease subunit [Fervidobacterium sp.]